MSDPGLIVAKLTAAQTAIEGYLTGITVSYMGFNIKVSDHVTPDQINELAAAVVDAVDTVETQWAAGHTLKS
jgi:hypothetical protein